MTREIKFRAWDKGRNEFLSAGQIFIEVQSGRAPLSSPTYLDIIKDPDRYLKRFTLEQFTGLKDRNGVDIYEGDIVRHQKMCCQVVYQAPSFVMKEKPQHKTWMEFIRGPDENQFEEVLGNIHD